MKKDITQHYNTVDVEDTNPSSNTNPIPWQNIVDNGESVFFGSVVEVLPV